MSWRTWLAVLVATLGYFVDIYDLILFSVVREASLTDLGFSPAERLRYGVLLIDLQMVGMLLGGLLWGILGDKRGRLSVLFGSILTYSFATLLNGFARGIWDYSLWRFIAGIGLAGELGVGVTLVAELMPAALRGWGTTLIATIGIFGAVVASLVGDSFHWRTAYYIGGGLGFVLLFLRVGVGESELFTRFRQQPRAPAGDFFQIFRRTERLSRYLFIILTGVPIWYVVGILVTFSPDLFREVGLTIRASQAILYTYIGLSVGDLLAGILSQVLHSRKQPILIWLSFSAVLAVLYNQLPFTAPARVYWFCLWLGLFSGYWAVLITSAAEQFGTNLRATVTTSVPNWIRGSLVLSTLLWQAIQSFTSLRTSALLSGIIIYGIALFSATRLRETYGVSLDFLERD
ncbi:MAG: MFS transporter [Bacteroidia bacterium]